MVFFARLGQVGQLDHQKNVFSPISQIFVHANTTSAEMSKDNFISSVSPNFNPGE